MSPILTAPARTAEDLLRPPSTWGNEQEAYLASLTSPWYRLIADLEDGVLRATVEYARGRGLRAAYLPLTTRTITCPTGLGSDSEPVPVTVSGVDTYLPDSMQFLLEYACRLSPEGSYDIMPSFRGERPDATHLGQFVHSEAEIPGTSRYRFSLSCKTNFRPPFIFVLMQGQTLICQRCICEC